jgi:hypothetical protein
MYIKLMLDYKKPHLLPKDFTYGFGGYSLNEWRKEAYGIISFENMPHPVIINRDYEPLAFVPGITEEQLASVHGARNVRSAGSAYLYDDGCSPAEFAKNYRYFGFLEKLHKLKIEPLPKKYRATPSRDLDR